mmetsp:Transcript_6414/g.15891  ORF Transcript_6414/g.15891 Transcript_6414/m.15891 type:complete len:335 (+) Transcript_6414:275-1279(+)
MSCVPQASDELGCKSEVQSLQQGECKALLPVTTRTSDAVDVLDQPPGHVVIQNILHVREVMAAPQQACAHQHVQIGPGLPETAELLSTPRTLRRVAAHVPFACDIRIAEGCHDARHCLPSVAKDECLELPGIELCRDLLQSRTESLRLSHSVLPKTAMLTRKPKLLVDVLARRKLDAAHINVDRPLRQGAPLLDNSLRKLLHVVLPRRREEQDLPVRPDLCHDQVHLTTEVSLTHFVCLVQDHVRHPFQVCLLLFEQVKQSTWRRCHNVDPLKESQSLVAEIFATKDTLTSETRKLSESSDLVANLVAQLPGRKEDQSNRALARFELWLRHDVD